MRSSIIRPSQISREQFDLESPAFTRTSTPTNSTVTPDMTSLTASGQTSPRNNGRILPERLKQRSRNKSFWEQSASQTGRIWLHLLLPVDCKMNLNTTCRPRLYPHWIWRHQLLLVGIYRSLTKNGRKCHRRRLCIEFLHNGVSDDHKSLHNYWER